MTSTSSAEPTPDDGSRLTAAAVAAPVVTTAAHQSVPASSESPLVLVTNMRNTLETKSRSSTPTPTTAVAYDVMRGWFRFRCGSLFTTTVQAPCITLYDHAKFLEALALGQVYSVCTRAHSEVALSGDAAHILYATKNVAVRVDRAAMLAALVAVSHAGAVGADCHTARDYEDSERMQRALGDGHIHLVPPTHLPASIRPDMKHYGRPVEPDDWDTDDTKHASGEPKLVGAQGVSLSADAGDAADMDAPSNLQQPRTTAKNGDALPSTTAASTA